MRGWGVGWVGVGVGVWWWWWWVGVWCVVGGGWRQDKTRVRDEKKKREERREET